MGSDIIALFSGLNFDLVAVGVTVAAIALLGGTVFLSNPRSVTTRTFFAFALAIVAYASANYLSSQINDPLGTLWALRATIFFATWASFLQFQLFYVFRKDSVTFPPWYRLLLKPCTALVSLFTLTPWVFSGVQQFPIEGQAAVAQVAWGVPIFGMTSVILVIASALFLIKKIFRGEPHVSRQQLVLVAVGYIITFSGILLFNVIIPLSTLNTRFLIFAPLWFFPFLATIAYATLKDRLFDVKTTAVSVLSFLLAVTIILQVIFSVSLTQRLFGASEFILVVIFSIWLIQATTREVQLREEIQQLALNLENANEKLKELDKMKSQFLSIASHDLRAPLTVIRNFVSLLLEGTYGKLPPAGQEGLQQVFDRATEMAKSVETYLNVSRIEQGRMKYDFVEVEFLSFVESAVKSFKTNAEKKGLAFSFSASPELEGKKVKIDTVKMNEVLNNLFDNSIKYTPQGSVAVTLEKRGNVARLSVKDTGVGMTKETKEKLFQLFSTGDNSRKINVTSTGVGLYITKAHAEAHGGKVWAESEGDGKGSTFILELPILP